MKEQKSFLASKAMVVPLFFEFNTFNDTEVTFSYIEPEVAIGVRSLVTNPKKRGQSKPDADKPKLIIKINLRARLLRQLLLDLLAAGSMDEFTRLQTLTPTKLNQLTDQQITALKTSYFEKNIIDLYTVSELMLYSKDQKGIDLVNLNLTDKNAAGYKVDKNCTVKKISEFEFEITKNLDPKVPSGFALATTLNRV